MVLFFFYLVTCTSSLKSKDWRLCSWERSLFPWHSTSLSYGQSCWSQLAYFNYFPAFAQQRNCKSWCHKSSTTFLTNKNSLPQASQPIRKCKSVPESARREKSDWRCTGVLTYILVLYFSQRKIQPCRISYTGTDLTALPRLWLWRDAERPQHRPPLSPVPASAAGGNSLRACAALPAGGWAGVIARPSALAWRRRISRWAPGWAPRRTSYRWTTSSCRRRSCLAAPRATCPAWPSRWAKGPAPARGTPSLRWRTAGTTTPGRHRAGRCRAGGWAAARGMLGARGAARGCEERSAAVSTSGVVRGYARAAPLFWGRRKDWESCSNN